MIRSMAQRALFLKVGLPFLAALTILAGIIMLPAIVAGGSKPPTEDGAATTATGNGLSDAVPEKYRAILMRAGGICEDITPALLAAQVDAESGWNPEATSPVGASGISQFMPATWKAHGKDGDGDGSADILNPIDAIWSQGNYMCQLREGVIALSSSGRALSGSTLDLTLAAYNAGLGNVQAYFGIPPFTETQNYVTKIKGLIPSYQGPAAILTGSGQSSVVEAGEKYIGRPYRGAAGGMDCCVFVQTAVRESLGIELPMFTPGTPMVSAKCEASMLNGAASYGGTQIPAEQAQPGDLVFFQSTSISAAADSVTHVGIYVGDNQVLDSIPGAGVGIRNLDYYKSSDTLLGTAVRLPSN